MRVLLLGPVEAVAGDGAALGIPGTRLRMLLARLALEAGRPVSVDALVDGLWGTEPPTDAVNALQSLVSRLRKVVGVNRLVSTAGGYLLHADEVDATSFEELAAEGRRALTAGRPAEALACLTEALGRWRGDALSGVLDAPFASASAARLAELRVTALEDRCAAGIALGRHAEVLADLEDLSAAHPLREHLAVLRMRALSASGRQAEALAVFERTRSALAGELGVDPSTELTRAHLEVLRGARPESRPSTGQLPAPLTSFVGRGYELDLLADALETARLVTLVGPGGAGKTRLATEAAVRHRAHDRGRAWFVALAPVRDARDVAGAVLTALGSLELGFLDAATRRVGDALDRIVAQLGTGEALLVLDNCEHLVDEAAALVDELLTRLPALRILATSREPLAITGEVLCPLGPLPGAEAVRLFAERAASVRPGFSLDETTTTSVREICRRLDGMPLAVELAAARLRSMSAAQIAERLDDRFRLLTSGSRSALPRQRTLRAVVEWSWDLLEKPERVLARRLSVFTAGATLSAIEATCADESLDAAEVVYLLGSLTEKSIVDVIGGVAASQPRYRMLETLRAYGEERLDEAGEREALDRRFAAYYLELAERHEPALRGSGQLPAVAVFEAEYDNMLTALRRAIERADAERAYRFVAALIWYWVIHGFNHQSHEFIPRVQDFGDLIPDHAHTALTAMYRLLNALPAVGEPDELRRIVDDCVRTGAVDRYPSLALILPVLAFLSRDGELCDRELRRVRSHPDPWARACARIVEALVLDDRGDLDGSERARDEALTGFRAVGDRWGIAMALTLRANAHSLRGDHARAIAGFQEGLVVARELSSADDVVQNLCRLGVERMRAGDSAGAWREYEEAARFAEESGEVRLEAVVRFGEAELARRDGDLERARRALDWLGRMASRIALPAHLVEEWLARYSVSLLVDEGRTAEARVLLPDVLAGAYARQDMPDAAQVATDAARLFAREGRPERAAWAVGTSEALRGVFDEGDPELRALVVSLAAELTESGYRAAYARGAGLSREDALAALLAELRREA
ncbi:BTAD domain-containing putative transcriptional regulator [Amycolatopsis cynarae]|uniref:BTAD domain-containing putative transcriptional regulator n=1 Tax=Amycolatopsis cynarae TaxID=2995223 RepID=A0ABY7B1E2_9PSEU|nr:BTAD domain-containing putative transcriptional regulator [Amycolatopsis sp. HUAS 11-8]WAL66122.1 BTAD domain-containing putative transcriptional regulator [Amycolatopsis sp. HUAS 11-8]